MKVNYQGNRDAKIVLLQIIGEHELPFIEEELSHIKAITQSTDFCLLQCRLIAGMTTFRHGWQSRFWRCCLCWQCGKTSNTYKNEVIVPLLSEHQDIKILLVAIP